jgi:hypothetical protein
MDSIYGAVPMEKLKERIHFAELAPKVIDLIPADGPDDAIENIADWTILHALGADNSVLRSLR